MTENSCNLCVSVFPNKFPESVGQNANAATNTDNQSDKHQVEKLGEFSIVFHFVLTKTRYHKQLDK